MLYNQSLQIILKCKQIIRVPSNIPLLGSSTSGCSFLWEFCLHRDGSTNSHPPRSQLESLLDQTWFPHFLSFQEKHFFSKTINNVAVAVIIIKIMILEMQWKISIPWTRLPGSLYRVLDVWFVGQAHMNNHEQYHHSLPPLCKVIITVSA